MAKRAGPGTLEVPPTRLNPTDAALWDIERDPTLRTTIVAALVLDRPVDPSRLSDVLEVATRRIPRLRQRVVAHTAGIGTPHWEVVPDFDLDEHLRVFAVDGGVDDALIASVAAPMAGEPFPRDRPLWELTYLHPAAGRAAVILKVHHSLTDGVGGIGLLDVILDRRRRAPRPDLTAVPVPVPGGRRSSTTEDGSARVRRVVDAPWDVASMATTAVFHPVRTTTGSWEAIRSAGRLLAPSSAPLSPLLVGRSMGRGVSMSHVDLRRLHDAAARHGCTINHAFFAGAIGGIAAYHRESGSHLERLRVTMPVSFRNPANGAAGNQWAPVRFVVPTNIDDPVDRMLAMRTLVVSSRREKALSFSQSLAGLVQVLPSVLSAGVVSGMMHGVDVTLTNVPGLGEPHFLAGAAVERIHAFAPTAGAALNVAFLSHVGTGCVGTLSDAAAVDDPALLGSLIDQAITDVVEAAERAPAARPAAPGTARPSPAPRPDRLTALDTGFLRLETAETPMHIGGALLVDGESLRDGEGRIRIEAARSHVEARLQRLPRFRRRIAEVPFGLGRPIWVDDEDFDIARHVRIVQASGRGDDQDLLDLCATLYATPLDRAHPLWDLAFVDGLADGRVGIVERVHHALVDGVGGVELAAALFDPEPGDAPERPDRTIRPVAPPGAPRRLADAIAEQALDPLAVARSAITAVRSPRRVAGQVTSAAAAARDLLGPRPPRAPFNQPPGTRRVLRAVPLPIADVRAIGSASGATVNDLVLLTIAGAFARWFDAEQIPPIDVHVLVPVSTRVHALGDGPGNQVGAVLVELPVAEPDRGRRLELIRERMSRLKAAHEGEGTALLLEALDHLPAPWYTPLLRLVAGQSIVNAVVTNVPGPPVPLYFLGSRIERIVPVVPLGAQLSLGIAVLSYGGELVISLFADPDALHDIDALAAAVVDEFDAVRSAVG
ncbi:MAG TPA: wax ester/triacylglycerol synthase family O-acyltransferase [Ilumatobacter sp.]|nr:wax ester/triacylglycerol synthase family O-acyltransferase [Ilumatobacter sp.]